MATCTTCGNDVTGKKFCSDCGSPVTARVCPQCQGEVNPGAAFCMHCGTSLGSTTPPPPPAMRFCPACQTQLPASSAFCTTCGHDMQAAGSSNGQHPPYTQYPSQPQYQSQYQQQPQYGQAQYQSQPYQQPQYQQSPQYGQPGYQAQPMIGQTQMVLRCPSCMAMAPVGTSYCNSCRTSLAGVVPVPASMPGQQNGVGGFLQGNGGKIAMGVLGGAAAVLGGEMLLNGVENSIENRVEGDMGYGGPYHHHHHHHREERDEGLLGGLGHLADDIGL